MFGVPKPGPLLERARGASKQFLERFSESGDGYIESPSALSAKNAELHTRLGAISAQIAAAADSVSSAGSTVDSNISKLLSGLNDVTRLAESD
jgi:hypothetical protein